MSKSSLTDILDDDYTPIKRKKKKSSKKPVQKTVKTQDYSIPISKPITEPKEILEQTFTDQSLEVLKPNLNEVFSEILELLIFEHNLISFSYTEFKKWFLEHNSSGNHFSTYIKQYRSKWKKETDIKNAYFILLELLHDKFNSFSKLEQFMKTSREEKFK